ncbi:MAG: FMN-binding protein [Candidatus Cloacimonetes bacterium]|nr:FMN-binding protein [Candidatus Cloacimonadota bacterium]
MNNERIPFRETLIYPIVFMIILSIIFVGVLALMYHATKEKVETYKEESYQKIVLDLCAPSIATATGLNEADIISAFPQSYNEYIKQTSLTGEDRPSFAVSIDDSVIVRVVDIPGKGLWDKMRALVAVSPDLSQIRKLAIYEQMETPGLGARISEPWFQEQFQDLQVIADGKFVTLELISEKQERKDGQINKVTGATISSGAVISMLKDSLQKLFEQNTLGAMP